MKELTSIMTSTVTLLKSHGFVTTNDTGQYTDMKKTIADYSRGNLTVQLRDRNYGNEYVTVEFNGLGVKKSKRMEYEAGDIAKIDSRIKRLVRTAQASADRDIRASEARLEKFGIINHKLCDLGFTGARKCDWTGRAVYVANGYELDVADDLTSMVMIGGERIKVDIEVAIAMAVLAPTKYKEED